MGKLPAKYILLDGGLWNLALYSDVTALVNESGHQYRICLNPGCRYSVTKRACGGCKGWLRSRWLHVGIPRVLSDSVLHLLAEVRDLAVHLHFQANSPP